MTRRAALAVATLAAFLFQIFVADTHWHLGNLGGLGYSSAAASRDSLAGSLTSTPAKGEICQICQALSASGRFIGTAPLTPVLPLAIIAALWLFAAHAPRQRRRAFAWQSRAPPVSNS